MERHSSTLIYGTALPRYSRAYLAIRVRLFTRAVIAVIRAVLRSGNCELTTSIQKKDRTTMPSQRRGGGDSISRMCVS